MTDLVERIRASGAPDRELDGDVAEFLRLCPQEDRWVRLKLGRWEVKTGALWEPGEHWPTWVAPEFTGSLDAVLRLLPPKWTRAVNAMAPDLGIDVDLYPPNVSGRANACVGTHCLETHATLIAVIKAHTLKDDACDRPIGGVSR